MKYMIVDAASISKLTVEVEKAIADGWGPQGGLSVDQDGFYQVMIKYEISFGRY